MDLVIKFLLSIFLLAVLPDYTAAQGNGNLKVLTINVWSGLDYSGIFKMSEYEDDSVREARFSILCDELKVLDPDVIFLQEANPAPSYTSRLAELLGYNEIHQVCNAGFKIGPFGLPVNLKEGNAILAKKELRLEETDAIKLSGLFGLHGDALSLHFDDAIFAVAGKIEVQGKEIILINTHLSADQDSSGSEDRSNELSCLSDYLSELSGNAVILGGDLNCTPDSPELLNFMAMNRLTDCFSNGEDAGYTWDPVNNGNVHYSMNEENYSPGDTVSRRIDYIFINNKFGNDPLKKTVVVFNKSRNNIFCSDHYGVLAELGLSGITKPDAPTDLSNWDALPFLSYDTELGLGYGLKVFLLSQLGYRESIDVTAFNSTKGMRSYKVVFSIPDFELRQRTLYPLAVDVIFEYYRMLKNSFFGIGNSSAFGDREFYTREQLEFKLQLGRGITSYLVLQGGLKFKSVRNFEFEENSRLKSFSGLSSSKTKYYGIYSSFRYDTRNSFINPSAGIVIDGEIEYAPDLDFNNITFERISLTTQYYAELFYPKTIFAARVMLQGIIGPDIPVQNLLSVGGSGSLRGYAQDRFLDKIASVATAELRFPLIWRLGGVLGLDAANVWSKTEQISSAGWKMNSVAGLRFYFDTFVARLDFGFSEETTGFFMEFGHTF